jgi:hypothetical protein
MFAARCESASGSKTVLTPLKWDVCVTPDSDQTADIAGVLFRATSGLGHFCRHAANSTLLSLTKPEDLA